MFLERRDNMKISSILLRKAAKKGLLERTFSRDRIVYKVLDATIEYKIVNGRLIKTKEPPVYKMKELLSSLMTQKT